MPDKIKRLRVSYSMLSSAEKGNWQEVSDMLFRVQRPTTFAMEEGKRLHSDIENHILKYNSFPDWLFNGGLVLPKTEEKVILRYNDLYDLSGIFDCVDDATKTLYEFKSGVQSSTDWARTHQIPIYFMMLGKMGRDVEKAYLLHFNQHTNKKDWTLIYNNSEIIKKAENYVETFAGEILNYLQQNDLI